MLGLREAVQLSTGSPASPLIITVLSLQDLAVRARSPVLIHLENPTCISLSFTQNWPPGGWPYTCWVFTLGPRPHLSGLARELVYFRQFLASEVP